MKSILLFSTAIIFFPSNSSPQDSISGQHTTGREYYIHVYNMDGSVLKGYLYDATPSGISVTKSTKEPVASITFRPEEINKIILRKKGSVAAGSILGALGGAAIGAMIGISSPDDSNGYPGYTSGEKTGLAIFLGALTGAGIGALFGATKKQITIFGRKENYKMAYPEIVERAMIQHQ